jgi:aldehyde:ferredoxin oxidoreductase
MAGYGAIVIKGSSDMPVVVAIHDDRVFFRDASTLWGMSSVFTIDRIVRQGEPNPGLRSVMVIGKAGESKVTYACVTVDVYRHFGRLGLGAVFGAKKLKGLVVSGKRSLPVSDGKEYRRAYDGIYEAAVASPIMKKYHDLGTPQNILSLNAFGGFPTRNLKSAKFEAADKISGEAFAEHYLGRRVACAHCPVACVHIAALREPHPREPYFYKTSMVGYDYEPICAVGPMLGVGDPEGVLKLLDAIEKVGMDSMSVGPVLSWATEAMEKGLVSQEQAGGLKLEWGGVAAYTDAIRRIAGQPNEFYAALARGVEHASSKYGGQDFALAFGGNEMPGYHTGPGAHAGYLVGARHSHLDNAGYSVDQKVIARKAVTPEELGDMLVVEESWRQVLTSLVVCYFAREIYEEETVLGALQAAGLDVGAERLSEIGAEIYRDKFRFKVREGFSFEKLRIPKRILQTAAPVGGLNEEFLRKTIDRVRTAALASAGPRR